MKNKLYSSDGMMPVSEGPMKPRLTVGVDFFPAAAKWEVGKKYKLAVTVTMKSRYQDDCCDDAGFTIESIKEAV